jgi:hypothetical protein
MNPRRRHGIVSLPVAIFFIALVAAAGVATDMISSGQAGLSNSQLSAESAVATRQAELHGLTATQQGRMLQLTQSSGVQTSIVAAIVQAQGDPPVAAQVSYTVAAGQETLVNVTQVVQSLLGGQIPASGNLTLVTSRGIYITSPFRTSAQIKQVTTYEQQSVQKIGTQLSGYDVSHTVNGQALTGYDVYQSVPGFYSCPAGTTLQGSTCVGQSITAAQYNPPYYTCPYAWSLSGSQCSYTVSGYWSQETQQVYVPGYWESYQYWVPGYWTSYTYSYTTTQTVWWGYYCAVFGIGCWSMPYCQFGALWCWPVTTTVVHVVTVEVWNPGFWATGEQWIPGYWTTQSVWVWNPPTTSTQPATYHAAYYSCAQGTLVGSECVTSTSTSANWNPPATTYLGERSTCPSGNQYSCSAVYQQYQYSVSLGQMQSCPSGSIYSCTPVYTQYTYTVTETVPVTHSVSYNVLSYQSMTWLVGG